MKAAPSSASKPCLDYLHRPCCDWVTLAIRCLSDLFDYFKNQLGQLGVGLLSFFWTFGATMVSIAGLYVACIFFPASVLCLSFEGRSGKL